MAELKFPDVRPVVRENGDSVLELSIAGEPLVEVNFTVIMRHVFEGIGIIKPERGLRVIK